MGKEAGSRERRDLVLRERIDEIGVITMNHPEKRNCLGTGMIGGILKAFDDFEKGSCRVVIIRAFPGARVWSAGHDIGEIPIDGTDPLTWNAPFEQLLHRVRNCPIPVMGMIEGAVWGGACDLAVTMDILVGTPSATFAITAAKLGLPYNSEGLSHFLGVLPLHIVKEMLFTAKSLPAEDAYRFGLLNRLVPPERLEEAAMEIARDIAGRAPLAIRVLRAEMKKLTAGPSLTSDEFENLQDLRQKAFRSADFKEGIRAFFEKRGAVFKGK